MLHQSFSKIAGIGAENELRLVNSKGEQIVCMQSIDNPRGIQKIVQPVVKEIREILSEGGLKNVIVEKLVIPELDIEQFEIVTQVFPTFDQLQTHIEDILIALETGLYKRYGNSVTIDQCVSVPKYAGYQPTTSQIGNIGDILQEETEQEYKRIDAMLTKKNIRMHANILGRHTNISFYDKTDAEKFFRSYNKNLKTLLEYLNTATKEDPIWEKIGVSYQRYQSYVMVCTAARGKDSHMPLEENTPMYDNEGNILDNYRLTRFKKYGALYGVESRLTDAVTNSGLVAAKIEKEVALLFNPSIHVPEVSQCDT